MRLVGIERCRSDQFRKFAAGQPAHQVHFEEAFLRVDVAQRARCVVEIVGADRDYAERVACHDRLVIQTCQHALSGQHGQACAQCQPCSGDRGNQDDKNDDDESAQNMAAAFGHDLKFVGKRRW